MRRWFFIFGLSLVSAFGFSQQNGGFKIVGKIPAAEDGYSYRIQVGSFKSVQNAERAFQKLSGLSLKPSYERYLDYTRVAIRGIPAKDVFFYLGKAQAAGFSEVFIAREAETRPAPEPGPAPEPEPSAGPHPRPAALPSAALREIAYAAIKVGETKSLADIAAAAGGNASFYRSGSPRTVSVDSGGGATGISVGSAFVNISDAEYIAVAVVPREDFYVVPESQTLPLPPESESGDAATLDLTEYRTEPTYRLAYRFNNKGEYKGASGPNGGIDILGRGPNYEWLWTTYEQGGWFYNLNGVGREMIDGYQKDASAGVELTVTPEFVYDGGNPYLQLRHALRNTNNFAVSGQRFGASADVMIHDNDYASLVSAPYGAYMSDSAENPSLELMFVGKEGRGIDPVDTLWLGEWGGGTHLDYIYADAEDDVHGGDSAIAFSYQNIDLAPGETKEFIVRFTLARRGE